MDTTSRTLSVIALILSIVAIFLSASFYTQTRSAYQNFENTLNQSTKQAQRSLAKAQAQARIEYLRARIQAGVAIENVDDEMASIRNDIKQAYDESTAEGREQINSINSQLTTITNQIKSNSKDAATNLNNLLKEISTVNLPDNQ